MQDKHDSEQATIRASFAHFFNNNKIDRKVLLSAFNSAQTICGPEGERIKFNSIDELKKALAEIDLGKKENYKMTAPGRLGNALDKYQVPKDNLSFSEQLIYEALIWHFEAELTISMGDKLARQAELNTLPGDHLAEMEQLQKEIKGLATGATQIFANELQKTDARIHDTLFTRLYDFFATPSLGRDIIIGIGIGVLTVGIGAAVIAASVGSAGIAPALFGAAAAGMSTGVVGGVLAAVGTAVVGFFAGVAAAVGKLVRSGSETQQDELTDKATLTSKNDVSIPSSSRVMFERGLSPGERRELTAKPIVPEAPKQDKPKMETTANEPEVGLSPSF